MYEFCTIDKCHCGVGMKKALLILLFCAGSLAAAEAVTVDRRAVVEVTQYVMWWARCCPKTQRRALREVILVATTATQYGLDPLLFATAVVTPESSWDPHVRGSKGERGLGQVHPKGVCARGFDLLTKEGALEAAASCFTRALKTCKNTVDAIGYYNTGVCGGRIGRARYRYRLYREAVRRFRSDL